MPLAFAAEGAPQTIQRITGSAEVRQHLNDLGFVAGGQVTVISTVLGNLIVKVKEARIAISREMANRILVG